MIKRWIWVNVIAFIVCIALASAASAQCVNGVCLVQTQPPQSWAPPVSPGHPSPSDLDRQVSPTGPAQYILLKRRIGLFGWRVQWVLVPVQVPR